MPALAAWRATCSNAASLTASTITIEPLGCPWTKAAKTRRLNALRGLLAALPRRQVAVYEDEVDIHLNPKIGLDWMGRGQQKEVMTPGQNEKRYLAGALDARSGQLLWVEGARKTSALFIALLNRLLQAYPAAPVIHECKSRGRPRLPSAASRCRRSASTKISCPRPPSRST